MASYSYPISFVELRGSMLGIVAEFLLDRGQLSVVQQVLEGMVEFLFDLCSIVSDVLLG
jgi:hypothetical protein